jgi:transcriptional regulator with XRE-family HTH domain
VRTLRQVKRRHAPYTKLKALLEERGVSQSELAAKLGKSPSALNQNLNGTGGDFSLSEVRLICSLFDISADEYFLYPGVSEKKPDTA